MEKGNLRALAPIGVFLVLYLGLGILFEYVLKIEMGFYSIPIVVIFLVALLVACFQNRKLSFDDKLAIMGRGIGDKTIVTMILIFMAAGIFVGTVGRNSAESVAYLMLSFIPPEFAVAVLFVVSCFVSLAMGTSVGTITLITPISVAVSAASGFDLPLCVASVMGGAMFGDNLSFISDTTIAACQGQGCAMKDKFRENFKIALPAALASLVIILVLSFNANITGAVIHEYELIELIPYLIVLVGGIIGINVFIVLLLGILSGAIIMVATGATAATDLLTSMGTGAARHVRNNDGCHSGLCHLRAHSRIWRLRMAAQRYQEHVQEPQRRPTWHGHLGWMHGYRNREQHRSDRNGQPHRGGHGENLQYLAPQDRIYPRYVLVRFPGHHPLWRTNAYRHCNDRKRRLCDNGIPDYSVLVLPLHAAHQFVGLYLPDSRPPRIRWRRYGNHRSVKKALSQRKRPRQTSGPLTLGEKAWNLLNATSI